MANEAEPFSPFRVLMVHLHVFFGEISFRILRPFLTWVHLSYIIDV